MTRRWSWRVAWSRANAREERVLPPPVGTVRRNAPGGAEVPFEGVEVDAAGARGMGVGRGRVAHRGCRRDQVMEVSLRRQAPLFVRDGLQREPAAMTVEPEVRGVC
jgi:hypothetical protein